MSLDRHPSPDAPDHEEQVPLITLPNWVKAAAACGFSIGDVFEELCIRADLANVERATLSRSDMDRLITACVQRSGDRHFPFALGESFAFEYLPDVETFLTTSPTLRESTRVFGWLRALINPNLRLSVHEAGEVANLRLDAASPEVPPSFQWFVEATFVAVVKFARALLQEHGDFARVTFCIAPPVYAAEAAQRLRLPVIYEAPHNALELDRHLLDLPLRGAFASLHQQAEQRVVQRLSERPHPRSGLRSQIERAVQRRPALLGQGIAAVAIELGLHPRTLQRRLRAEDLSFAALQDELRLHLARRWLRETQLDLETISERLGFSDRRSFSRAFQRWTGDTPSAYRAQ